MLSLFGLNYRFAIVGPTLKADMMGQYWFMTLRTSGEIGHFDAIMRSPHIPFGLGFLLFWYRHN